MTDRDADHRFQPGNGERGDYDLTPEVIVLHTEPVGEEVLRRQERRVWHYDLRVIRAVFAAVIDARTLSYW